MIRFPVDSLSIEVSILLALMLAASAARIAAFLVPIVKDIGTTPYFDPPTTIRFNRPSRLFRFPYNEHVSSNDNC